MGRTPLAEPYIFDICVTTLFSILEVTDEMALGQQLQELACVWMLRRKKELEEHEKMTPHKTGAYFLKPLND